MNPIYVTSRARVDALLTPYKMFGSDLRAHVRVVVRPDEEEAYRKAHPTLKFIVLPEYTQGLSPTRQWLLERAIAKGHDHLFLLDDDMTGLNRKEDLPVFGTVKTVDAHVNMPKVMETMIRWMDAGVAQVGFTNRSNSARTCRDLSYVENTRNLKTLFYRVDALVKAKVRFDRVIVIQDSDVNLQLLRQGFSNRVSIRWSYNARAELLPGGCAIYRTKDTVILGIKQMAELHPGLTKGVQNKKNPGVMNMHVSWKKAAIEGGLR